MYVVYIEIPVIVFEYALYWKSVLYVMESTLKWLYRPNHALMDFKIYANCFENLGPMYSRCIFKKMLKYGYTISYVHHSEMCYFFFNHI